MIHLHTRIRGVVAVLAGVQHKQPESITPAKLCPKPLDDVTFVI